MIPVLLNCQGEEGELNIDSEYSHNWGNLEPEYKHITKSMRELQTVTKPCSPEENNAHIAIAREPPCLLIVRVSEEGKPRRKTTPTVMLYRPCAAGARRSPLSTMRMTPDGRVEARRLRLVLLFCDKSRSRAADDKESVGIGDGSDLSQMGSHRRRRNDRLRVSGLGMYIPCANQGARGNLRDSEAGQEILSNCNEYPVYRGDQNKISETHRNGLKVFRPASQESQEQTGNILTDTVLKRPGYSDGGRGVPWRFLLESKADRWPKNRRKIRKAAQ
ncbi:hypothetical protein B0H13DRAFT_1917815 [Mycena leptocephala]|nr:hypothetical protein B0H13DRAFT_1917815 [Mycena leptocephala]